MRIDEKHIVLTTNWLNGEGILKHGKGKYVTLSDFMIQKPVFHQANDVVFLSDDNKVQILKCRDVYYDIHEENKNYIWYCDNRTAPISLEPNQIIYLGQLLRLHSYGSTKLTKHEFDLIVLSLFRKWYPDDFTARKRLNNLRTKYISEKNENRTEINIARIDS